MNPNARHHVATESDLVVRFVITRREWLRTEWPAVLVWGGLSLAMLGTIGFLVTRSAWWSLLLPIAWPLGVQKTTAIAVSLLRGSMGVTLHVRNDGVVLVAHGSGPPQYGHWTEFVDAGETRILVGADGRYRVVLPKLGCSVEAWGEIQRLTGTHLDGLRPGGTAPMNRR